MEELEKRGVPGKSVLRNILSTSEDPMADIKTFQSDNAILLPSLKSGLPLLDLLEVSRFHFNSVVLDDIQKRLLSRVTELGQQKGSKVNNQILLSLVDQTFPLVKLPTIRPVVLSTLKALNKVPEKYLKAIKTDPDLYDEVDMEVKQQIWESNEFLFLEELEPLIDTYLMEKSAKLSDWDSSGNGDSAGGFFFAEMPKSRRLNPVVQQLVKMVLRNSRLQENLLAQIRDRFVASENWHFCSLRAEFLMALHDAEVFVNEANRSDPGHVLAWCLDACLREKRIDTKHGKDLQQLLDSRAKSDKSLGILAMIAGDPHTQYFLQSTAYRHLVQCSLSEIIPREHNGLQFILRLAKLGLNALNILKTGQLKEEVIDSILLTKFLAALLKLMIEDQIRTTTDKFQDNLPEEIKEIQVASVSCEAEFEILKPFLKTDPLCASLLLQYTLDLVGRNDSWALMRIVPHLSRTASDLAYSPTFLHCFTRVLLTHLPHMNCWEQLIDSMLNNFLFKRLSAEPVVLQTARLLQQLSAKFTHTRLEQILKVFADAQKDEPMTDLSKAAVASVKKLIEELLQTGPTQTV